MQQVAIAKTLGNLVQNEGAEGIYKISLDDKVNERAKYLKGSLFWHFDGSLQPYPNLATVLRAVTLSDTGGDTEFCNTYAAYDDLPLGRQRTDRRSSGGAQCGAVAVLRDPGDEPRGDHLLAEVADKGLPHRVDTSIRSEVIAAGRNRGLRHRILGRGQPGFACAPS